ncbi:GAF and ANTAR domain-containing protein [Nocardioides sp. 1609]|uniref:GAF and ANTAR domain-containing protein n=1 Tax=Nocardioides sp. 1609 TaxID=2508327 RepID=UPI00106FA94C|nr:GAF and ANTAR domain-containing protein [Nocardioides sp. 1609]
MNDSRERRVIRAFVNLSNELAGDYDVIDMLATLTTHCADLLDVASAGLLLSDGKGTLHLAASSSERTEHLETFQLQRDQGPCLDSYRDSAVIVAGDLTEEEERWPQFVPAARKAGFLSVHALPMLLRGHSIGTLGLFGDRVGRLDTEDLDLAQALAQVAGVAVVNERAAVDLVTVNAQLQHALTSRIVLEQAKGIIAHTGALTMSDAFDVLRRYARNHGRKLSDVATGIVNRDLDGAVVLAYAATPGVAT